MAVPTPAQLKAEIEGGPLAADLAAYWTDVFEPHPTKQEELAYREGKLKPDAAFEIHRILTDPTRRTRTLKTITRGAFLAAVAPMALALPTLSETKQQQWTLLLSLLTGGNDDVDITRPQVQQMLDLALSDGLLTSEQRTALTNGGTVACSRAEELGWEIDTGLVALAKEVA